MPVSVKVSPLTAWKPFRDPETPDVKLSFVITEAISAPITLKTCFEKRFQFREFDFEVLDEDSNLRSSQLNLGIITNFL
jgi:hypothetical protein